MVRCRRRSNQVINLNKETDLKGASKYPKTRQTRNTYKINDSGAEDHKDRERTTTGSVN